MSLPREFHAATRLRKADQAGVPVAVLNATQRFANLKRPVTMSTFLPTAIHAVGVKDIAHASTATHSMSLVKMRTERYKAGGNKQRATTAAAIVPKDELNFIQSMTRIETREHKLQNNALLRSYKEAQEQQSRLKREKMNQLDHSRSTKVPPSLADASEIAEKVAIVKKAQMLLNEEEDDCKRMNSMVLYSKVVTIRDQQLVENKKIKQKHKDEETRLDLISEVQRLKALHAADIRNTKQEAAAREGALTIMRQMQERREAKQRQTEALKREKKEIIDKMANMRAVDAEELLIKEAKLAQMMEAVKESNAESIKLKASKRLEEQALEEEVIQYNKKKLAADEIKASEAKKIADEKEREIQLLREAQEKAADRQAEIDQLRAKRAAEQRERDYRSSEIIRVKKEEADRVALNQARKRQFADQQSMKVQMAEAERTDFIRIIKSQKEEEEREREMEAEKVQALLKHKKTIQQQISKNEDVHKQARLDYLEDGKRSRDQIEEARQRIQRIKQDKVQGLHDLSINNKYKVELQAYKIGF